MAWVGSVNLAAPFLEDTGEGSASHPLHALVVDDETLSRAVTARMLKVAGFEVHEAASGKEALKVLTDHPDIKLAVVDVVMPEMNGVTLATRLPEMAPACQVILMTGYSPNWLGLADLISRFPLLQKPFSLDQLKAKVQDVLRMDC